jgi:hypothetical protein
MGGMQVDIQRMEDSNKLLFWLSLRLMGVGFVFIKVDRIDVY